MTAPLLLVALDSADPDLLLHWSADGTLPGLRELFRRGAHVRLTGPETVSAHGVWLSIWSGVSLAVHGRYLRRPLRPGGYGLMEPEEALRGAPPFWAALAERATVAVLDAPDALPFRGLRGPQIFGWGSHPSEPAARSEPPALLAAIEARFGPRMPSDETQGSRARDRRALSDLLERVARQGELARHLLAGCDVGIVGFGDAHAAGHRFWKYGPQAAERVPDARLGEALREVYCAIDGEIARILASLPRDAHVAVVTNHGIREGYPTGELMQAFCHRLGYQTARAGRFAAGARSWLLGMLSRGAARLGIELTLPEALAATDWERTTAFAIPSDYTGLLQVNLRGREPRGCVEPADYTALLDRLESDLRALVDAETGEPAVERVTRSAEAFGASPPTRLPDLFVEWRLTGPHRVVHPRASLQPRRAGRLRANLHSRSGLALLAGPRIRGRGDRGELSPCALAPLFLALATGEPAEQGLAAAAAFEVR